VYVATIAAASVASIVTFRTWEVEPLESPVFAGLDLDVVDLLAAVGGDERTPGHVGAVAGVVVVADAALGRDPALRDAGRRGDG
jgi:hypothetical protein